MKSFLCDFDGSMHLTAVVDQQSDNKANFDDLADSGKQVSDKLVDKAGKRNPTSDPSASSS